MDNNKVELSSKSSQSQAHINNSQILIWIQCVESDTLVPLGFKLPLVFIEHHYKIVCVSIFRPGGWWWVSAGPVCVARGFPAPPHGWRGPGCRTLTPRGWWWETGQTHADHCDEPLSLLALYSYLSEREQETGSKTEIKGRGQKEAEGERESDIGGCVKTGDKEGKGKIGGRGDLEKESCQRITCTASSLSTCYPLTDTTQGSDQLNCDPWSWPHWHRYLTGPRR